MTNNTDPVLALADELQQVAAGEDIPSAAAAYADCAGRLRTLAKSLASAPTGAEDDDGELVERVARAIAKHGFGRPWDDFHELYVHDTDKSDLREYARAAIAALARQPASDKFIATFRCEGNGIVGTTPAKIHAVTQHDDGCIEVVIDHWPQQQEPKP